MKLTSFVFVVIFFLQIAPIPQLSFMSNISFVQLWSSTLLFIIGIVFMIEFARNLPDAKGHKGAKTGAYVFLVMGFITFGYGTSVITGLYDPLTNAGSETILNIGLTVLLGVSAILLYAGVHPTIVTHNHVTLAKHIRNIV